MTKKNQVKLKTFTEQEINDATKIVNEYVSRFESTNMNQPGVHAIPAKMHYVFSVDHDDEDETEAYHEANRELDVNAKFKNFYLYITPVDHDTFDQHVQYLLQSFFGRNVNESMEEFFEFTYRTPVSILEFIQMLSEKGFIYNSNKILGDDDSCVLPDLMKTIEFVKD